MIQRMFCRLLGHKINWSSIDRTGFRCARCHRYVRSHSELSTRPGDVTWIDHYGPSFDAPEQRRREAEGAS